MDLLQDILTHGALLAGLVYVIGGFIVITHLGMLGIQEYQVLKTKYLVVGLEFCAWSAFMFLIAWSFLEFEYNDTPGGNGKVIPILGVSIPALAFLAHQLFQIYGKKDLPVQFSIMLGMVSGLAAITLALYAFTKESYETPMEKHYTNVMSILAIIFYLHNYAVFMYRKTAFFRDGLYSRVSFAIESDHLPMVENIGLPVERGLTIGLDLIDETDKYFIVGIKKDKGMQVFELDKSIVKVMAWENITQDDQAKEGEK